VPVSNDDVLVDGTVAWVLGAVGITTLDGMGLLEGALGALDGALLGATELGTVGTMTGELSPPVPADATVTSGVLVVSATVDAAATTADEVVAIEVVAIDDAILLPLNVGDTVLDGSPPVDATRWYVV